MKVILILVVYLLCLFLASVGIACCKVSGDVEEDAERCFEEWLKSKSKNAFSE